MENSKETDEVIAKLMKANDEWIEIVEVYRSVFEVIADKVDDELRNSLGCRASRGICLNEVKQIALTIVGKYNDEEFHHIYYIFSMADGIASAGNPNFQN